MKDLSDSPAESMRWQVLGIAAWLFLMALFLFWPARAFDFINLDDYRYVADNWRVTTGLTWGNIVWAFTTVYEQWYLPLLWISYMLDTQFMGIDAAGYHATNIVLHALTTALLFGVLFRMTGSLYRSAAVALLFAVHPLRVESVVWISARKDVLSGFFFVLAVWAYVHHVQQPSRLRYGALVLGMVCGLLSKSIVLVLPVILLLLDFWPLRRADDLWGRAAWRQWRPLIVEKVPLMVLAVLFAVLTLSTHVGGRVSGEALSLMDRLALIFPNYVAYLQLIVRPVELAILYPEQDVVRPAYAVLCAIGLFAVTLWFLRWRARAPYLIVGWIWFLATLAPVIRGVRLGLAEYADRFTYLPSMGLTLLVVWGISDLLPARRWRDSVLLALLLAVASASWVGARYYLSYWQDSESLFKRALSITGDNHILYVNLGAVYNRQGRTQDVVVVLKEALRVKPHCPVSNVGLGAALREQGSWDEATEHFLVAARHAPSHDWGVHARIGEHLALLGRHDEALVHLLRSLEVNPYHFETHHNIGMTQLSLGRPLEALGYFNRVLETDPDVERSLFGLGNALMALDRHDEAARAFMRAMDVSPAKVEYQNAYAVALSRGGRSPEAVALYEDLLTRAPDSPELLNNLAWLLAATPADSVHDPVRALDLALRAVERTGREHPRMLNTLAVAYAANGQFDRAAGAAEEAIAAAERLNMTDYARQISGRLERYRAQLF